MKTPTYKAMIKTLLTAAMFLSANLTFAATVSINLTAQRMSTTLPDGATVPMWGFCTTGSCSTNWAPGPTIYASPDDELDITLANNLKVPTSIVILGQLGGGLGSPVSMAASTGTPFPQHPVQSHTTFVTNGAADPVFTPPPQLDRISSFGNEVAANSGTPASGTFTWGKLQAGTYIYETGTLPSLEAPMGLYGVLIVTQQPVQADPSNNVTFSPGIAYGNIAYDAETAMLFSEIDPIQNMQVDIAEEAGTDVKLRFNDPACGTACYPAAANYTPTYFLINGQSFDKSAPQKSAYSVASSGTASSNNILLHFLNAGLRTHIPTVVGLPMSLVAEDGNVPPGNPKIQNEVLLTAGKTYDVLVNPNVTSGAYDPATFAVFDRKLALTNGNAPDGGQQGFLLVNGSISTVGPAGGLPAAVTPMVVDDSFNVPLNTALNGNVKLNDIAVAQVSTVTQPANGTLVFNTDGTFIYTPNSGYQGLDTFTYTASNVGSNSTATVTLNVASMGIGGKPTANNDSFTSNLATKFTAAMPGVLANDTDPSGYPLTATSVASSTCTVSLNPDGSFTATPITSGTASCTFTYTAQNSQGTQSLPATVTVAFGATGSKHGLNVAVFDANSNTPITDYRWTIQQDLTFKHDTTGTPTLGTPTLGTSFHKSHMTIVATGCVGSVSCGSGQQVRGQAVDPQAPTQVSEVALDPTQNYYISILPGDAGNPAGGCTSTDTTVCPSDGSGHMMGGTEIKPADVANSGTVNVALQATPLEPAQLSVYIYEDNSPTNGQDDLNETGLGDFSIILVDAAGRSGDPAGQQTYDAFNMPLSNALLGRPGCPDIHNSLTNGTGTSDTGNLVGVVYTCPNDPNAGTPQADTTGKYSLAGHALIKYITPARYDVIARPGPSHLANGEVWWQTETLEGTSAQDAFTGINEPVYFQEFGPPGFHTTIGFVNPDHVKQYAIANGLVGNYKITGKITNERMSHPSDVRLWDSGSYDLLSSTTCQVALNSQAGDGPSIAIAQCNPDGTFTLSGVPPGDYLLDIWDQWLDQIIQEQAVTVVASDVDLKQIPVLSWFTQHDQNIFLDQNGNGVYDEGEPGIPSVLMTNRYRDGGISNQTLTDASGNGLLAELFPLFNWYVSEGDLTHFKQTGVNIMVDGGGPVDTSGDRAGLTSSQYADGTPSNRIEIPGSYSYGNQGFISQRNIINWGRAPYVAGENGGIQGTVVYSTTRPFDDQRYNVQTIWEPLVPRVTVNLYRKQVLPDGTNTLTLVDTTQTSSWDDFVNALNSDGTQANIRCPGQLASDPFVDYTLKPLSPTSTADLYRCYDGFHNWNQVQPAPYDGRYNFPSAAYVKAHANEIPACQYMIQDPRYPNDSTKTIPDPNKCQTLVSLPHGQYVVEAVTPPGYEVVKEEDKNILIGDAFNAPVTQQFGPLASIFIIPDQATLNDSNPFNPSTGDPGFQSNPTSSLGVQASKVTFPECVGELHRVPDYLSLFPQAQQVAPFAGMDRPLCDRKLVNIVDQAQSSADFFVFTEVPEAANGSGIILNDASSEFNAAAPDFGEKASVPFVPVSVKDFNGREVGRTYSDQWGAYNMMTPSSWLVNPPTPSGYGPNMLVTCINDPGPIPDPLGIIDPVTGKVKMVTDPQFSPAFSNFCYTLPFMPGRTTYLDTPVLPIAAFASGYNPPDCSYPDATPAILRVDGSAGFGPYLTTAGGQLTITALGDQQVQNPAYAGPFATSGPSSLRTINRHYGFGDQGPASTVTIGGVPMHVAAWSDTSITVDVPAKASTGELVITAANGKSSVDAVTVTIENKAPKRVQGANGDTIQAAIDAATPGDLILIDAGTYNELLIMWKPVRLQGVGAADVIINAAKFPTSKLATWRPRINDLFAIDANTGNQAGTSQIDPLPTQEITGGVVLLEPTVLGSEEGAGITVLAKNLASNVCMNSRGNRNPISVDASGQSTGHHVGESNFLCATSRIDGLSITGGDAGGGIYVNGWAHNLEISNNRVYGNAGAYNGGVRIGVPYLELASYSTNAGGNIQTNGQEIAGFGYDNDINIHHNAITKNGTVEAPAGAGGAGGGVSICTGTDGYSIDHNWICGNYGSSDGGGIGHIGFSQDGKITNNNILFNQSFQQSGATHGGGIAVLGEPAIAGTLSLGTGNLTIDSNVIRGNFAEGGQGGGIRLQQVNGADVEAFPTRNNYWFKVAMTNNMVDNNVAGWAGGGISMSDTIASSIINNTVASNDSAGIAGVVLANGVALPLETPGVAGVGKPSPAGLSVEQTSAQLLAVLPDATSRATNAISNPGLVNNIIWQNRSFYYSGDGRLCSSNDASNASTASCNVMVEQNTTGQCTNTLAGTAPAYWDIGVLGDTNTTPTTLSRLNPIYSVLTSFDGAPGSGYDVTATTKTVNNTGVSHNGNTVTIAANGHGFSVGKPVTVTGVIPSVYNGTFTIVSTTTNTFTYADPSVQVSMANTSLTHPLTGSNFARRIVTVTTSAPHGFSIGDQLTITVSGANPSAYNVNNATATVTGPNTLTYSGSNSVASASSAATNPGNSALSAASASNGNRGTSTSVSISGSFNTIGDPHLVDMYCNGSRVTPEFPGVINPPSPKTLQVAATVDEGNNYVNMIYGPLYLSKPTDSNGTGYVSFGDYHLNDTSSSAYNMATASGAPSLDIDGDNRPQGAVTTGQVSGYDIGADEYSFYKISPTSLSFGSNQTNTPSSPLTVTFTNVQNVAMAINGISICGTGTTGCSGNAANNFTISNNTCGTSLAANTSCNVSVTFTPSSTGSRTATLLFNDAAGTQVVPLSGTGVAPSASRSPTSLAFGYVLGGSTLPVTLSNTGVGPLSVTSVTMSGTNSSYFTQSNDCVSQSPLPVGGTCTINVTFTPSTTSLGSKSATMSILDAAGTQTVSLTGAPAATVGFSWAYGGTVGVWGTSTQTRTITVTNSGPTGSQLSLTQVPLVANTLGSQFNRTGGTCSTSTVLGTSNNNRSCTVIVSRTRPAASPYGGNGTLTVNDTGAVSSAQVLNLSGT